MHGDKFPMGYSLSRAYECAAIRRICCYGKTQQACRAFCVASLASLHSDSLAARGIATRYLAQNPRTLQVSTETLVGLVSPGHLQLNYFASSPFKAKESKKSSTGNPKVEVWPFRPPKAGAFLTCMSTTFTAAGERGLF